MNILPVVFASFIPNFVYIVDYVGGISVSVCLIFPALLCIYGRSYLNTRNILVQLNKHDHNHIQYHAIDSSNGGGSGNIGSSGGDNMGSDADVDVDVEMSSYQQKTHGDSANTNSSTNTNTGTKQDSNQSNRNEVVSEVVVESIFDHIYVAYSVLCIGCVLSICIITNGTS